MRKHMKKKEWIGQTEIAGLMAGLMLGPMILPYLRAKMQEKARVEPTAPQKVAGDAFERALRAVRQYDEED